MPIIYKTDVLAALKEKGYNTNRIRKDKIMGEAMLQKSEAGKCPRGLCWKQSVICWTANRRTLSSSGGTLNKRVCQRKGQRCFLNENRAIMAGFEAVFSVQQV